MKVLLVQPPVRDFYATKFRNYPLGLLYIASKLIKEGFSAKVLDAAFCRKPRVIPFPPKFEYLKKYYTKENNLFLNYKHFGMSDEEIRNNISAFGPDYVCISSMFTPYVEEACRVAKLAKEVSEDIRVVAGGHHATADPGSLLGRGDIDCVIRGEGETLLPNVLRNDIIGKIYPDVSEESAKIDDLNELPLPARELLNAGDFKYAGRRYTMLLTSRGCPHGCSFCSVHNMVGHKHRKRDVDSIVEEMDLCFEKYDIMVFDFQDDNLLFDVTRIKILLEKIIMKWGNRLLLLASNGLNVAHMDAELIGLMKKAGFSTLDIALGTGETPSRGLFSRPETLHRYEEVLRTVIDVGLGATTYIILGFPFQPIAEMRRTFEYLKNKPTLISPSIFYNVPGMPVFNEARAFEYLPDHMARRGSAFNNFGVDFERDDIFRLFKEIRNYNLSKSVPGTKLSL